MNKFTNVKAMNRSHFNLFFLYVIDMHNNSKEDNVRYLNNPLCARRVKIIKGYTFDTSKLKVPEPNQTSLLDDLVHDLENLEVSTEHVLLLTENSSTCQECKKTYKKPGFLKSHLKKEHGMNAEFSCDVCKNKFPDVKLLKRHKLQH